MRRTSCPRTGMGRSGGWDSRNEPVDGTPPTSRGQVQRCIDGIPGNADEVCFVSIDEAGSFEGGNIGMHALVVAAQGLCQCANATGAARAQGAKQLPSLGREDGEQGRKVAKGEVALRCLEAAGFRALPSVHETLAHLRYLEEAGRVLRETRDGVWWWSAV